MALGISQSWPAFALVKGDSRGRATHRSSVRLRAEVSPRPSWALIQEAYRSRWQLAQHVLTDSELGHRWPSQRPKPTEPRQFAPEQENRAQSRARCWVPGYTLWALEHSTCLPTIRRTYFLASKGFFILGLGEDAKGLV